MMRKWISIIAVLATVAGVLPWGMALRASAPPGAVRGAAEGHTYFVGDGGDDGFPGSSVRPFQTLQKGVSVLKAGDTLNVRTGTYGGFVAGWDDDGMYGRISGTAAAPIVIQRDPEAAAGSVVIDDQNNKTPDAINFEKGIDWVTIRGFVIKNSGKIPRNGIRVSRSKNVSLIDNTVTGIKSFGISCSFTTDFLVQGNRVVDNPGKGDPTSGHGIYIANSSVNPIIRGNLVAKSGSQGIHLNGDQSAGEAGVISGALIEDNIIVNNINNGINGDGVQESRIQNNLIIGSTKHGISLYHLDSAGAPKNNVIVSNTIVEPNGGGAAIQIAQGGTGNVIVNNILLGGADGTIKISDDSRPGLVSDNNIVLDHFMNFDGEASLRLAQWRTDTKQDQHSLTGVTPATLFVDIGHFDFRLAPKGPAIGAGRKPPVGAGPATEPAGQPKEGPWDIGAHPPADAIPSSAIAGMKSVGAGVLQSRQTRVLAAAGMGGLGMVAVGAAGVWAVMRRRGLNRWIVSYIMHAGRRGAPGDGKKIHVMLCIGDHFEPHNGEVSDDQARARLNRWLEQYPALYGQVQDSDGRPPRHTFFYPIEQYRADHVEAIASLCRAGFGEMEVHLHHDHDTSENLRRRLEEGKQLLAARHGMLARDHRTGKLAYGFIHGDWALDNSGPGGRGCGVNNELDILRETGCYADFTLPSAPDQAQTSKINSIYYAVDDPERPRSHNTGQDVGKGTRPEKALMLIQGPLLFNWNSRKFGIVPRVENACVQGNQPATMARLDAWLRARVQVPQRPDWFFVKLHAHGANEDGQQSILGPEMQQFHRDLAEKSRLNPNFQYHYVTAREMYNLVKAAEAGWKGSVADALNFELVCNFAELERKKTA